MYTENTNLIAKTKYVPYIIISKALWRGQMEVIVYNRALRTELRNYIMVQHIVIRGLVY